MEKSVPFLLFNLANRLLGLDCAEINRVIMDLTSNEARALIAAYKTQKKYYSLWDIFKVTEKNDASSFIIIKQEEGEEDFLIEVPAISTIINLDIPHILVVPEYIKSKQNPLFIWGLAKSAAETIILITFSFFYQIKDKQGHE